MNSVQLNLRPDSNWHLDNTGQIQYKDKNIKINLNKEGFTISTNGNQTLSLGKRFYGPHSHIGSTLPYYSNDKLKAEIEISAMLFEPPDIDGYIPIRKEKVTIKDKEREVTFTNEVTVKVRKEVRTATAAVISLATFGATDFNGGGLTPAYAK